MQSNAFTKIIQAVSATYRKCENIGSPVTQKTAMTWLLFPAHVQTFFKCPSYLAELLKAQSTESINSSNICHHKFSWNELFFTVFELHLLYVGTKLSAFMVCFTSRYRRHDTKPRTRYFTNKRHILRTAVGNNFLTSQATASFSRKLYYVEFLVLSFRACW
jgi:hypothetical protein